MTTETMHRAAFLKSLSEPIRAPFTGLPAPMLDELLAQTLSAARAAWPAIALEEEVFLSYLAQRVPEGVDPERRLSGLAGGDLYLACACAGGDERAIAALEGRYFGEIDHALRRLNAGSAQVDDVKQRVRQYLFVGEAPAIANYSGSGGWPRSNRMRSRISLLWN